VPDPCGRHRYRRHHPARRQRLQHVGGTAGRTLRCPPDRGRLGRGPVRADRRPGRGGSRRGARAGRGPPARPFRPAGGHRRPGGVVRRRLRAEGGQPRRPGPARRLHRHRHRWPEHAAGPVGRAEGEGRPSGQPAVHPDADGQRLRRQPQPASGRPGVRPHPGVGLRLQ
ncbi:MAG: 3-oxoacyl-[acyl-carrier-protein] synthase, KASII, partial [uncultured Friedmanniella sp.]